MPSIDTPGGSASLPPDARRSRPDAGPRAPAELLSQLRDRLARLPDNHPSRPPDAREAGGAGPADRVLADAEAGFADPELGPPEPADAEVSAAEREPSEREPSESGPVESGPFEPGDARDERDEPRPGGAGPDEPGSIPGREPDGGGESPAGSERADPGTADGASARPSRHGPESERYPPWFISDPGMPWFVLDDPR